MVKHWAEKKGKYKSAIRTKPVVFAECVLFLLLFCLRTWPHLDFCTLLFRLLDFCGFFFAGINFFQRTSAALWQLAITFYPSSRDACAQALRYSKSLTTQYLALDTRRVLTLRLRATANRTDRAERRKKIALAFAAHTTRANGKCAENEILAFGCLPNAAERGRSEVAGAPFSLSHAVRSRGESPLRQLLGDLKRQRKSV